MPNGISPPLLSPPDVACHTLQRLYSKLSSLRNCVTFSLWNHLEAGTGIGPATDPAVSLQELKNISFAVRLVEHVDSITLPNAEGNVRQACTGREFGGCVFTGSSSLAFAVCAEAGVPLEVNGPGGCEWEQERKSSDSGDGLHLEGGCYGFSALVEWERC